MNQDTRRGGLFSVKPGSSETAKFLARGAAVLVLFGASVVNCGSQESPLGGNRATSGAGGTNGSNTGPGTGTDTATGGTDTGSGGTDTGSGGSGDFPDGGSGGAPMYMPDASVMGGMCTNGVCTLNNGIVEVTFTQASGNITAKYLPNGLSFIKSGTLSDTGGTAAIVSSVTENNFAGGQAIEVTFANGNKDRIILFPGSAFAYFKKWFANKGTADSTIDKAAQLKATLGASKPAANLKAQGTAGLTAVNGHSGSYAYLAVADPATRNGVVAGWVTNSISNGIVFSGIAGTDATLTGQTEFGKLRIKPGQTREADMLEVGYFTDARLGLEAYANDIATAYAIKMKPNRVVYCTWYAGVGGEGNQTQGAQTAGWLKNNLVPFGFSDYQIDDGWQVARRRFDDYNHGGSYSNGMKPFADVVKSNGMSAGIWFMPNAGNESSTPPSNFPDNWYLKAPTTHDGLPVGTVTEVSSWAGTSLDVTVPAVKDYVKKVADLLTNQWGYRYLKTDGMFTGIAGHQNYINDGYKPDDFFFMANLSDPYQTPVEAFRNNWKLVRETVPQDTFIMGCTISQNMRTMSAGFGLMDAERIGPDNKSDWATLMRGILRGGQRYFLNGRVFWNDPDPTYVRNPMIQSQTTSGYVAFTGFMYTAAEDFASLSGPAVNILKRTMPFHGSINVRPADYFDRSNPEIWLLTDTSKNVRRDVIGLFNFDAAAPLAENYSMAKLGLSASQQYVGFDFWANKFVAPFSGTLDINVAPTDSRIIAVRPVSGNPMVVSTSRHISQGIYDILQETWDAGSKTLSGKSRVVGNDPYELRIYAANASGGNWTAGSATVSAADQTAGVTVAPVAQSAAEVRVTIRSTTSREISWSVVFN